jgi:hypothetical protein
MRVIWHSTAAWVLVAAVLTGSPSVAASSARFVPGEVIVQFAQDSEGHRMVTRAGRQPAPDLSEFASVVARLESKTGIPLTAKQLLSGQRLLLEIETTRILDKMLLDVDRPALAHLAVQRLSVLSDIADAQPNYRSSIRSPGAK